MTLPTQRPCTRLERNQPCLTFFATLKNCNAEMFTCHSARPQRRGLPRRNHRRKREPRRTKTLQRERGEMRCVLCAFVNRNPPFELVDFGGGTAKEGIHFARGIAQRLAVFMVTHRRLANHEYVSLPCRALPCSPPCLSQARLSCNFHKPIGLR